MTSTPSTTASSNPYPPSDPAQLERPEDFRPAQEGVSLRPGDGQNEALCFDCPSPSEGVGTRNGEATGPLNGAPIGTPPGLPLKRKWENEATLDHPGQESLPDKKCLERSISPTAIGSELSSKQTESIADSWSSSKRLKTVEQNLGLVPETGLSPRSFALPAAIWQHIFCFVPPVFLGRLLCVNHAFNAYLTPGKDDGNLLPLSKRTVQPLNPGSIWFASRKRFCPGLPRPLQGMTELSMWRLLRGRDCQNCGDSNFGGLIPSLDNPWESGPGHNGLRIIWPFGIRCCGSCLQEISKKEIHILLSSDFPYFLLKALPVAFVSESNHFVGYNFVHKTTAPPTLRLSKHYYKPHLKNIMRQFRNAKELGAASADEWTKGLDRQGQERNDDAIRWEQWETKGGLRKVNSRPQPKPATIGISKDSNVKGGTFPEDYMRPRMVSPWRHERENDSAVPLYTTEHKHPALDFSGPFQQSRTSLAPFPSQTHYGQQVPHHQLKPERNIRDVNEAKVARRADIECRCAALDPPILRNVLNHMESFQAALQISQPMTDQAWQVLKPRLLAQLPYAERREKERVQHAEILEGEYKQRRQQEAQLKETKENFDREWEIFQGPVRSQISTLADMIIDERWSKGKSITKETSPKFAADVLTNVRKRYYNDIAMSKEAAVAAGEPIKSDLPNGPPTGILILENMKWVFDNKIKHITDLFQKELFLCNGCDGNFKFYGFEGVIQHYAAKHTAELSMGDKVVHWRAEWPEHPPFHPNPSVAKSAFYKLPTPVPSFGPVCSTRDLQGVTSHNASDQSSETGIQRSANNHGQGHHPEPHSESSMTPYQEAIHQTTSAHSLPHVGPALRQDHSAIVLGSQHGYTSNYGNISHHQTTQPGAQLPFHDSSRLSQHPPATAAQGQASTVPHAFAPHSSISHPPMPYTASYPNGLLSTHQPRFDYGQNVPAQGPQSDLKKRQMEEMAKHAKDVFTGLGGIKDLPGSVRIFVTIHITISRFKVVFLNEPSLAMFLEGLDHNATMRPVRSVNGLACKTCVKTGTAANVGHPTHGVLMGDRRLYTLPHLVNHFKSVHLEHSQTLAYSPYSVPAPEYDWKHDMIELPEPTVISNLQNATGMTHTKLGLIASVFPDALPSPLPKLRGEGSTGPVPVYRADLDLSAKASLDLHSPVAIHRPARLLENSEDQPFPGLYGGYRPLSQDTPSETPGEDEYDPHRPALGLGKTAKIEHGSNHSQKPAQNCILPNGQRASSRTYHEDGSHNTPDDWGYDDSLSRASPSQGTMTNRNAFQQHDHTTAPLDPRYLGSRTAARRDHRRDTSDSIISLQTKWTDVDVLENSSKGSHLTRDWPQGNGTVRSSRNGTHDVPLSDGADGAEQFFPNLAPSPDTTRARKPATSIRDTLNGFESRWSQEIPAARRPVHIGEKEPHDERQEFSGETSREEDNPSTSQMRTGIPEPREDSDFLLQPRSRSRPQYYDEYRLSSRMQIPLNTVGDNHKLHGESQLVLNQEHRLRHGSESYQVARQAQHRDRSASPFQATPETALYRTRSPVEEDRRDTIHHAQPLSSRKRNRSERIISYGYPPGSHYEYVEEHDPQPRYRESLEYLPIRYEDSVQTEPTRYVVAQPVERRVQHEYIHYEPSYAVGPIYEHSGQDFRPNQRQYTAQPVRTGQSDNKCYEGYEYLT